MFKVGNKISVMKFDDIIKKFPNANKSVENTNSDWVDMQDDCGCVRRRWIDIDLHGVCVIEGIQNNKGRSKSTIIRLRGNRDSWWINEKFIIKPKPKYINKER